jgi:hypothetical protein
MKCALVNLDAFSTHKYLGECTDNVLSCVICGFYNAVGEDYSLLGYEVMYE